MTLMSRLMTVLYFLLILAAVDVSAGPAPTDRIAPFERVAPGMEYRRVTTTRKGRVLVMDQLRCDPEKVRFSLMLASDGQRKTRTARARDMAIRFGQTAVINASYFDEDDRVIGYHERLGQVLEPDVAAGGVFGGIFFWNGRKAGLKARGEALPSGAPVIFQAGPRLVWDGRPIAGLETTDRAARSGVSLDERGRVSLYALGLSSPVSLAELPALLSEPVERGGLASWRALNFDGGSSTQFSLRAGRRVGELPGMFPVPAFLGVSPRAQ